MLASRTADRKVVSPSFEPSLHLVLAVVLVISLSVTLIVGCAPKAAPRPARPDYLPTVELTKSLLEIARLEDQRAVSSEALFAYAKDDSPVVRARVARAIGRIQDSSGIRVLAELEKDESTDVRKEVYFALGQMTEPDGSPDVPTPEALLTTKYDGEQDAQLKALIVQALGKVGTERSRPILFTALKSSSPLVRGNAAVAIGLQVYKKHARPQDSETNERMVSLLDDPDPEVRWKTAYAFVRSAPNASELASTREALQHRLTDKNATVRVMAARALGEVGDGASLLKLQEAMNDGDWRVRVNCLRAVAKLKGSLSMTIVEKGLADPHPLVQQQAVATIGALGDPEGIRFLEPLLNDPSTDSNLRTGALASLTEIQGDDAFDTLMYHIRSEDPWTRIAVVSALGLLSRPEAVEELRAIAKREDDPRVMAAIADAIGIHPAEISEESLIYLLSKGDAAVVTVCAKMIGRNNIVRAMPQLIAAFERQTPVRDWEPRAAIVKAMGELGLRDDRARDILTRALADPDYRVSAAAADAYEKVFHQEAKAVTATQRPVNLTYFEASRYQRAILETEEGTIVLRLYPEEAPLTVSNFVHLARQGFFDGLTFHRVVPNFVAQAGCPRGDGWGGPGYTIRCEVNPQPYLRGSVGMALSGKDTGGSQFFITHSPEPHLDGIYTVFGQVIEGFDVVDKLTKGSKIYKVRVPGDDD